MLRSICQLFVWGGGGLTQIGDSKSTGTKLGLPRVLPTSQKLGVNQTRGWLGHSQPNSTCRSLEHANTWGEKNSIWSVERSPRSSHDGGLTHSRNPLLSELGTNQSRPDCGLGLSHFQYELKWVQTHLSCSLPARQR